ncbi:MAG: helix-turn-helix domain-containing protein [Candidatus Paceibacterota bacterium]|jgi:transcriptional regulator with XRE-family HTH domain
MNKNLLVFGENLRKLRLGANLTLRDVCKIVDYDPSNWSKIERGVMAPPKDRKVLEGWANTLKLVPGSKEYSQFMDEVKVAQGAIPEDILADANIVDYLPAFFRTIRNKKPTKEDIDLLIKAIKNR